MTQSPDHPAVRRRAVLDQIETLNSGTSDVLAWVDGLLKQVDLAVEAHVDGDDYEAVTPYADAISTGLDATTAKHLVIDLGIDGYDIANVASPDGKSALDTAELQLYMLAHELLPPFITGGSQNAEEKALAEYLRRTHPPKGTSWTFTPIVSVTANGDGTYEISASWHSAYSEAWHADGVSTIDDDEYFDPTRTDGVKQPIGPAVMDQWLTGKLIDDDFRQVLESACQFPPPLVWESAGNDDEPRDQRADLPGHFWAEIGPDTNPEGWTWTVLKFTEDGAETVAAGCTTGFADTAKAAVAEWVDTHPMIEEKP